MTLTAWGNAVNGNGLQTGDRAASTILTITAGPPDPTATATGRDTPTVTATAVPSATPTSTPTPTTGVTPGQPCAGDCNNDRRVTVDELVAGVNIALNVDPGDTCRAFDVGGDGVVTIDELLLAVDAALNGCPH